MEKHLFVLCILTHFFVSAQSEDFLKQSQAAQEELNAHYLNRETSILLEEDFKVFKGLNFYPLNAQFIVTAQVIRTPDEKPFLMPTTTERLPEYVKYAEAHFELEGKSFVLNMYRSTERESSNLFVPFTDLTSGDGSYGGGRYLTIPIPEEDTFVLDFNMAYNPYCAYNPRYSCPIPPEENDLLIRIEAGVMDFMNEQ